MAIHHQLLSVSDVKKTITFQVPQMVVDQTLQDHLVQVQKSANLKGFRKGHVPISLVESLFGTSVRKEAWEELKRKAFWEAAKAYKVEPASAVRFEASSGEMLPTELVRGKELSFEAHFEVFPNVEWTGLEGMEIKEQDAEVSDEEFQKFLQQLKEKESQFVTVDEAEPVLQVEAEEPLFVELSVAMSQGEKTQDPFVEVFKVGRDYPPTFWSKLDKMKVGETREFDFPDEVGTKPEHVVHFHVTFLAIKSQVLPDEEELATQAGMALPDFLTEVRQMLSKSKAKSIKDQYVRDVYSDILARHTFEVPPSLVQEHLFLIRRGYYVRSTQAGHGIDEIKQFLEENKAMMEQAAEKGVREEFVVEQLAKKWSLSWTQEDTRPFLTEEMIDIFEKGSEEERLRVSRHLRIQVLRVKVAEKILENARFLKAS